MDMQELNELADAFNAQKPEISLGALMSRWQNLFGYSEDEARKAIKEHRADINGRKLSNKQWDLIRANEEADEIDRETYEHRLQLSSQKSYNCIHAQDSAEDQAFKYLFKLGGPFPDIDTLRDKVRIPADLREGEGDGGKSYFAYIDADGKRAIEDWLKKTNSQYHVDFFPVNEARKDLCATSSYPTLGIDSTLPQHRMSDINHPHLPAQTQYPVWYFFYGTLMDPRSLQSCISASEPPDLIPASVKGGVIRTHQQRKYKALVDGPATAQVDGFAFLVENAEQEGCLRYRETNNYEVVRCEIVMNGKETVRGLTFRFAKLKKLDVE
ncbi:MAG: hypothetical protein Q9220_000452 [cf. Caloplaca sp. 1 TL-2023]